MQYKTVIFDIDGVIIRRGKVFSVRFSEKYHIDINRILEFFKGEFQDCLVGRMDLKEVLPRWLEKWGVKESVDRVLDFWFSGEAEEDSEMLKEIGTIRLKGWKTYAVTNNEKYRVQYLLEKTRVSQYFDKIIASAEIGLKKPEGDFYKKVQEILKIKKPGNIYFWDDDKENVDGAIKAGWNAKLFMGITDFRNQWSKIGGWK